MLTLQHITYAHPNKDILFRDLSLVINKHQKVALVGSNGAGKSTLLRILSNELMISNGIVRLSHNPYYVPQILTGFDDCTIAEVLHIQEKLDALQRIAGSDANEVNFDILSDDWSVEERSMEALTHWGLHKTDLHQKMGMLSGGEKVKVFLAGITLHKPEIILLDEPSNHLDMASREMLYQYIGSAKETIVVISHDRTLLNLLDVVYELNKGSITAYGGNYDFYVAQKGIENNAKQEALQNIEKELRKAKQVERESLERKQRRDSRGRKKQDKAGVPTIAINTLRNKAENSASRMKEVHNEKIGAVTEKRSELRKELPHNDKMKVGFNGSELHAGKVLFEAKEMNYSYGEKPLWKQPLSFSIASGKRYALAGDNGAGKTTLIKIILGVLPPSAGNVQGADIHALYLDQDYSIVNNDLSVYEQLQRFNTGNLSEHELKSRLTHFLFTKEHWDKRCTILSGGEKMKLMLCCLTIPAKAPDMIILDEPTNNLDIASAELLTNAINAYEGAIIVVSHDKYFVEQLHIDEMIALV